MCVQERAPLENIKNVNLAHLEYIMLIICLKMFSENIDVFVKIFTFVTTPLKVSKYCDFFLDTK